MASIGVALLFSAALISSPALPSSPHHSFQEMCVAILMGRYVSTSHPLSTTSRNTPDTPCSYSRLLIRFIVTCSTDENCLFHSSNGYYPAGIVCCPTSSIARSCTFWSTCYNSAQVSATPSLSSYNPNFLCTDPASPYCATATYAEIDLGGLIIGGGCANSQQIVTLYTEEGVASVSSGTVVTTVAAMSTILWADDNFLQHHLSGTTSSATSPALSSTSTSSPSSPSRGGSTPAGVIAGSVVGSVVGVAGITAATIMVIMHQRRAKQNKKDNPEGDAAAQETQPAGGDDDVTRPFSMMKGGPELHELGSERSEIGTESRGIGTEPSDIGTERRESTTEPRVITAQPRELTGSAPVAYELPG